jgi:hypothetical protein
VYIALFFLLAAIAMRDGVGLAVGVLSDDSRCKTNRSSKAHGKTILKLALKLRRCWRKENLAQN